MMGSVHGELGNISKAMECLSKAVQLNSQNADAWLIQGLIQQKTGNKSLALTSLQHAVNYANDYDVAHFSLAKLQLEIGDKSHAQNSLQQVIVCNPSHVEAWHLLGTLYQSNGEFENALKCYTTAIGFNPKYIDSLRRIPVLQLAVSNVAEAERSALNAISAYPNDAWVYINMADVRIAQGRLTEAADFAKKAMEQDRSNIDLVLKYADVMEKRGDYEVVLEILRPMLESMPPVHNAVIIFAKFAPFLDMKNEASVLIGRLRRASNMSEQQIAIIEKASAWLDQQI